MTMTEPALVEVPMPAEAYRHPKTRRLLGGILDTGGDLPSLEDLAVCTTRLPAFRCACGERHLRLVWPSGLTEWQTPDGCYIMETRTLLIEWAPGGCFATERRDRVVWPERAAFPVRVEPLSETGQIAVADAEGLRAMVEADTVEALVEYAREGNERDFRDLAAMSGVPRAQLDELWQGTRARLHPRGAA